MRISQRLLKFADRYINKNVANEIRLSTNQMMKKIVSLYRFYGYTEYGRKTESGYGRVNFKQFIEIR